MRSSTQKITQNDGPNIQMRMALDALEHVEDCRWRLAEILAAIEARLDGLLADPVKYGGTPERVEQMVIDLLGLRARILGLPELDVGAYYDKNFLDVPRLIRCLAAAFHSVRPAGQKAWFIAELGKMVAALRAPAPTKAKTQSEG